MQNNMKLVLKDGRVFEGYQNASNVERIGELVFNTSMVGYQEILTDPSYCGQIVIMTYPLIGNYGINEDDNESKNVRLNGLIVKEYNNEPSNFRSNKTLSEVLNEYNVPLLSGIDTRMITRIIRDEGSQIGLITSMETSLDECLEKLNNYQIPTNQVEVVSSKRKWISKAKNPKFNVVCIDFGTKLNIIRKLNQRNCNVTVVPHDVSVSEILALDPDGLFLSNGPGNPESNPHGINLVRELRGKLPIFGICLGHQIISLALGAKTFKLKFGHRGANHPVKNLITGKIEITSQNHSYAVDRESIKNTDLEITHINILDDTIEGVKCDKDRIFSVQYHPESASGPEDSEYLFDTFNEYMSLNKGGANNA